jgi:hypothetical protein
MKKERAMLTNVVRTLVKKIKEKIKQMFYVKKNNF